MIYPQTIIIPALDPDAKMTELIRELRMNGFEHIIVVNDGSGKNAAEIFREALEEGCTVIHHRKNKGKGAAIRAAVREILLRGTGAGVITVDADGQHLPCDVVKIARAMEESPDALILGTRDFTGDLVPARSRLGNRLTSGIFRITTGKTCSDTQTGLRGIPERLLETALMTEGERYEYEMNFLTDAAAEAEIREVPVSTIYEDGNQRSHYRTIRDSLRFCKRIFRFAAASLISAACDYGLFLLLAAAFAVQTGGAQRGGMIAVASITARVVSGIINFQLNKRWSFRSTGNSAREAVRYFFLFLGIMAGSAFGTAALSAVLPAAAAKAMVDAALFAISYIAQKKWVFKKQSPAGSGEFRNRRIENRRDIGNEKRSGIAA